MQYRCLSLIYPGLRPDQREAVYTRLYGVGQLLGVSNPYGYLYPDVADAPDLPESAQLDSGFGYVAVMIQALKPIEPAQPEIFDDLDDSDSARELWAHSPQVRICLG